MNPNGTYVFGSYLCRLQAKLFSSGRYSHGGVYVTVAKPRTTVYPLRVCKKVSRGGTAGTPHATRRAPSAQPRSRANTTGPTRIRQCGASPPARIHAFCTLRRRRAPRRPTCPPPSSGLTCRPPVRVRRAAHDRFSRCDGRRASPDGRPMPAVHGRVLAISPATPPFFSHQQVELDTPDTPGA